MADVVGNMHVRLGMDLKEFIAKQKQFNSRLTGMQKRAATVGRALKGMFAGLLGTAVVVRGLRSVTTELQRMSDLTKVAKQIGVSTEAFTGLQHAADQMTTSGDKFGAGMQTMAKRLGEAARGIGAAKPALEALGLSAENLVSMSADQAFLRIADAISKVEDPMQRTALAANIFSKGNQTLVQMMTKGAPEIRKFTAEAKKLGLSFSDEAGKKAEDYVDAMDRLKKTFRGFIIDIAPTAAENLKQIADLLATVARHANKIDLRGLMVGGVGGGVATSGIDMSSMFKPGPKGPAGILEGAADMLGGFGALTGGDAVTKPTLGDRARGMAEQFKMGFGGGAKEFAKELQFWLPGVVASTKAMFSSVDKPPTDETMRQVTGISAAERGSAAAHSLIAGALDPQIVEQKKGNKILREIRDKEPILEVAAGPVP